MASNMDREMILADFQVNYLALFPSHLKPRGFPVPEGWPLPSVYLTIDCNGGVVWGVIRYVAWVCVLSHRELVIHRLCMLCVCVKCVRYGLNGTCRVKGCYGNWVMNVDGVVFPVLYAACVELGSIKCKGF